MNIGRIITIFLILQILGGLVFFVAYDQAMKANYPYMDSSLKYTAILIWQFAVWLILAVRTENFILAVIIPLAITLFLIWIAYKFDEKLSMKKSK